MLVHADQSQESVAHRELPGSSEQRSAAARRNLRYSVLSAVMGEIDAAKVAGIMAAINAQIPSAPAATASASGSQKETSYNWLEIRRPAAIASGTPSKSPITTRTKAPRSTYRTTFVRSAPSAIRIPISFVRCATV